MFGVHGEILAAISRLTFRRLRTLLDNNANALLLNRGDQDGIRLLGNWDLSLERGRRSYKCQVVAAAVLKP